MDTIGVRELRSNLARVLRAASDGHAVTITQHGEPRAQIGPVDADAPDVERLLASGALVRPRRRGQWRPPPTTTVAAGTRIDVALRDLRG